ncbi:DUF883 family protein [Marilutibacter chinensis]|uniref:DUF883 family protein n=1 Tax=Marilutibacter chinensis TaxID=2912247 RepID=A0ABS9HQ44_9GAMM|nr:DUF883 family protein [Lysobacter chinensis]MCF7220354.1 DUF883 family protein [Lysobacter chinensis]
MRHDLHGLVDQFEVLLQDMADATGERPDELKRRADRRLRKLRSRLSGLEQAAAGRARAIGRSTRGYVSGHPWIAAGAVLAAVLAVGLVARRRLP